MGNKKLSFQENAYQYMRGIQFLGDVMQLGMNFKDSLDLLKKDHIESEHSHLLRETANLLQNIHKQLYDLFFTKSNQGEFVFQKNLAVKHAWLKNHHKNLFYLYIKNQKDERASMIREASDYRNQRSFKLDKRGRNQKKQYQIRDLLPFQDTLKRWLDKWEQKSNSLKKMSENPKNELFRYSEIAEHIKFFSARDGITYIYEFLQESVSKEPSIDKKIDELKRELKIVEEKLKQLEQIYLPSQSSGIDIAKGSFNYYTVNKKPKEYYEDKLSKIKKQLYGLLKNDFENKKTNKSLIQKNIQNKNFNKYSYIKIKSTKTNQISYEWIRNPDFSSNLNDEHKKGGSYNRIKNNQNNIIFTFKSEQERIWVKRYCKENALLKDKDSKILYESLDKESVFLSLDQTYTMMKAFKAEQKSIFFEIIAHIASKQNIKYKVNNPNHILHDFEFPYQNLNLKGINKGFSLFKFTENQNKKLIDKLLIPYKNEQNKVAVDKVYDCFVDITKKIQDKATAHNHNKHIKNKKHHRSNQVIDKNNKQDIQRLKKERGLFLFEKKCYFKEYGKFCEDYKEIAQKRGRLIAQIKGVEKERQESQQTSFWALMYCDDDQKQLWLVPKEKMQSAKQFIDEKYTEQSTKDFSKEKLGRLFYFESLTKRALHKLCFAEESSFVAEMSSELKKSQKQIKKIKTNGDKKQKEAKAQQEIEFFKKLLQSDYANRRLSLKNFNLEEVFQVQNKIDWEMALEKACYFAGPIALKSKEQENFLSNYDVTVLKLDSYDLEGRNKNTYQTPVSPNRRHTDLWEIFCQKAGLDSLGHLDEEQADKADYLPFIGEVRLNPEVKIRWRRTDKALKEYFKKKRFADSFQHRRLQDQLTAHFTLTLNAGKIYPDLAFAKPDYIRKKMDSFNQKINKEMNFKTAWKYGIDRGQKELATLCLVKFNPDQDIYKEKHKAIVKPEFPHHEQGITSYTLRDLTLTGCIKCGEVKPAEPHLCNKTIPNKDTMPWSKRPLIKNLSFFLNPKNLNNPDIFEKDTVTCLDLTTAKVIKGHIITNGDVMTYLKLKKAVAKRKLYELYHNGKVTNQTKLFWSEQIDGKHKRPDGALNIKTTDEVEKTIYQYSKKYENMVLSNNIKYSQQNIENSLTHYLHQLRQNDNRHTPSIEQVNHLRSAITANMVGVICYLQKRYPGFVILEDLNESTVNKHFLNNTENISRRLESALYNRFQSLGLVPPHVKDIIRLREEVREEFRIAQKEKNKRSNKEHKNKLKQEINKSVLHSQLHSSGLIPEQITSSQIGAIVFVDEKDTSKICPYCEERLLKNQSNLSPTEKEEGEKIKKIQKRVKYEQGRFVCGISNYCGSAHSCGFDTYYFKKPEERAEHNEPKIREEKQRKEFDMLKDINDNDKVASYNIAKKIKTADQIGKWDSGENK